MVYKEENLMNRRNWLSALLAVMMVISMMTCIALPAVAEIDYTMLPLASASYLNDGFNAYQINSVGELLAASANYVTSAAASNTDHAIDAGDTVYLTADLDIADWNVTGWAVENPDGTYTTVGKITTSTGNYRKYDPSAEGIVCQNKQEVFAALYMGFNARNARYTHVYFNFDGLGHTIYNYYAPHSFFAGGIRADGLELGNINFVNALVDTTIQDTSLWSSVSPAIFINSSEAGTSTAIRVHDVHVFNSKMKTDTACMAGIIMKSTSNGTPTNRPVKMENCSVVGSMLENVAEATSDNALLIGSMENGGHIKNCVILNSTLKIKSTGYAGRTDAYHTTYAVNSFVASDVYDRIAITTMENITVAGCKLLTEETVEPHFGAVLGLGCGVSKISSLPINHIYVADNYWATLTNGVEGAPQPISALVHTRAAVDAKSKLAFGSDLAIEGVANLYTRENTDADTTAVPQDQQATDLEVTAVLDRMNANLDKTAKKWKLDASGMVLSVEPLKMTFKFVDGSTEVLYSDAHGKYTVDNATKALLSAEDWLDEYDVPTVLDYDNLSSTEDVTYYMVPHALRYVGNNDQTHNIVCDKCDEHDQVNVPCTPVEDPENDVLPGYFNPASKAYTCEHCTNTWVVPLSSDECPAPYTLTFDKVDYYNNGSEILLTLAAESDANLNALTVDITFPAENMAYVSYVPADGYMATVNTKDAASGKLSVTLAKMDGTTLTAADVAVLKFTAQGVDEANATAFVSAEAEVTALIVDEGNTSVKKMPENKFASDNAVITYLVIGDFIAGDINSDGSVTLLDAALLIQKMNGTIHPKQDGANFMVLAADVNNDGAADTGDVVLLLRVATLMEVNLVKATEIPVIAYVE